MTEAQGSTAEAVIVEEHVVFTLATFCRASGANRSQVQELVFEGLLDPTGGGPADWRFSGPSLRNARRALRLAHDLELGLSGAAIVMNLLAEIDSLRARLSGR